MPFTDYKKLPTTIFATWADTSDDPYLETDEERDPLVEQSDRAKVVVGTYQLVKKETLMTKVVPAHR